MNYYELRKEVSKLIPRMRQLVPSKGRAAMVEEKGRKTNYKEFSLIERQFIDKRRLLNTEEVSSFLEISLRAVACPMPFNLDVWDGLICTYNCLYCYANSFRASLYTSFFDNSRTMGLRHCNPIYYKRELDTLLKLRGTDPHTINSDIGKAIAMEIPLRMGIRFEDFLPEERRRGISLQMIQYLSDVNYPLMINTKSDLIGQDAYVRALSENGAGAAVHITMISGDSKFLRKIEPGAPSFEKRIRAAAALSAEGIRVVARIEPYLIFLADDPAMLDSYMWECWNAGIRHITFDTYSYSAKNPGIRKAFLKAGFDFDRIFLLGCDSQGLGSLLLDTFMAEFRKYGFKCSTFDLGCVPTNNQMICCEVGDWFESSGWNYGSVVSAIRFVRENGPVGWKDFENYVNEHGGFLSDKLRFAMHQLWNLEGNPAYQVAWGQGMHVMGRDEYGLIWIWKQFSDFRQDLMEDLL